MQGCHFRPQPGRTELDATSAHPIEREGWSNRWRAWGKVRRGRNHHMGGL
jgi:hypothetical protein